MVNSFNSFSVSSWLSEASPSWQWSRQQCRPPRYQPAPDPSPQTLEQHWSQQPEHDMWAARCRVTVTYLNSDGSDAQSSQLLTHVKTSHLTTNQNQFVLTNQRRAFTWPATLVLFLALRKPWWAGALYQIGLSSAYLHMIYKHFMSGIVKYNLAHSLVLFLCILMKT